jgi:tRNA pseudouridine32 synthase / 23S rRNA pseudouridine746 synthase
MTTPSRVGSSPPRPSQAPEPRRLTGASAAPGSVAVRYCDAALLIVDKPAGLLAVPGRGEHLQDCVAARVQALYADAKVVHRLDQATSGLMSFGRGDAAQRALSRAFESRSVAKRYIAVVAGLVVDEQGWIDLPLAGDWPNRPRQQVDHEHGKASQTRWRVLSRDAALGRTRLELEPLTGRSHQLRVHLLAIGHPIVGDALYAPPSLAAARLMLHASELTIPHPVDGRAMNFSSAAPF